MPYPCLATKTATIAVSAFVLSSCTVAESTAPVTKQRIKDVNSISAVGVKCSNGTTYSVAFDASANPISSSAGTVGEATDLPIAYPAGVSNSPSIKYAEAVASTSDGMNDLVENRPGTDNYPHITRVTITY